MSPSIDEKLFLQQYDSSKFEKVSVTADLLIFAISDLKTENYRKLSQKNMSLFLIKRDQFPFKESYSLPGGFLDPKETLTMCAKKVLKQKTNLDNLYLEQLYTFDEVNRDPRMRILSVAYMALIDRQKLPKSVQNGDNWFNILFKKNKIILQNEQDANIILDLNKPSELAFDHAHIIQSGLTRLKNKIEYTDLAFHLLPTEFTLTEAQNVYEAILGNKLLAPAFRRMIKPHVTPTGKMNEGLGHRPSAFYRLKK